MFESGQHFRVIVVVSLVGAVAVGVVAGTPSRPAQQRAPIDVGGLVAPDSDEVDSVDTLTVHVSGAVAEPGLVEVSAGSRVADVVALAGGTTIEANLMAINLAAPVADGQQIVVPGSRSSGSEMPGREADGLIRLNAADAGALEQLPGVGPVLASNIVAYRERNGPFEAIEDLLSVSGIGEAKLSTFRDRILIP